MATFGGNFISIQGVNKGGSLTCYSLAKEGGWRRDREKSIKACFQTCKDPCKRERPKTSGGDVRSDRKERKGGAADDSSGKKWCNRESSGWRGEKVGSRTWEGMCFFSGWRCKRMRGKETHVFKGRKKEHGSGIKGMS